MRNTKVIGLFLIVMCHFSTAWASGPLIIKYLPADEKEEKEALSVIKQSELNELVVELSNSYFPFNETATIQYGGDEGPMYDPEIRTIHIPYTFYLQTLDYFTKNDYQKKFDKDPQYGALDTLLHTILHEVGHAFVHDQAIPILGKEEDAVDNFATLIMINYLENGADSAISAADMFAFESEDRPDYYDFGEYIDEHSFDLQRYFSTLCLVYGNDPETHKNLLDEVENDYLSDRKEFCEYEYQNLSNNWSRYLKEE
ncbi:DUF4344 domain-containing metallopeptidase [Vibrio sp. ZSDE26]|uniref:DUF4344 domain-containing metallopeptidase n=1 Tax=Vibrio amylolyticus TaxID=2847292 RepID=A0A9X1XK35_9VIBR|nr:DUF4344 domain-containing metallopeptidase [Vibrio amylolyticus]MCK6264407.1 DUF4344 domain-containing metallopeptidase [Vibrio amylolyticus]